MSKSFTSCNSNKIKSISSNCVYFVGIFFFSLMVALPKASFILVNFMILLSFPCCDRSQSHIYRKRNKLLSFSVVPIWSITIHMCKYFAEQIYSLREYWFSSCDYYGTNSFEYSSYTKRENCRIKILWSESRSPCLYGNLWYKHTFILLHCAREIGFSTLVYSLWNFLFNRSQFAYQTNEILFSV